MLKGIDSTDSSINRSENDLVTLKSETKVIELAPKVFEHVRNLDGITSESIMISLNPMRNRKQIFSAGEGSGKSGSFFFFSHDG